MLYLTGDNSAQNKLSVDNVAERDYLRTEGDPGAAGYTINEAVALTRSTVSFYYTFLPILSLLFGLYCTHFI